MKSEQTNHAGDELRAYAESHRVAYGMESKLCTHYLALLDQITATREDAARLDWLERTAGKESHIGEHARCVSLGFHAHDGLRATVDAAMERDGHCVRCDGKMCPYGPCATAGAE